MPSVPFGAGLGTWVCGCFFRWFWRKFMVAPLSLSGLHVHPADEAGRLFQTVSGSDSNGSHLPSGSTFKWPVAVVVVKIPPAALAFSVKTKGCRIFRDGHGSDVGLRQAHAKGANTRQPRSVIRQKSSFLTEPTQVSFLHLCESIIRRGKSKKN